MLTEESMTAQFAQYWSAAAFGEMPAEVIVRAKQSILDTLAAAIAGVSADESRRALAGTAMTSGHVEAGSTVWGTDKRLPPSHAALVNGTTAHARELDDTSGVDHSGAVVIPAVLAAAEATGADGRQVLVSAIAGYDVGRRILDGLGGYDVHTWKGWHSTGTVGSFASAAAAAKCVGLAASEFTYALGIAGSFTGGTWAFHEDRTMTKRLHPGKAAQTGLEAAFLANAGFTGPTRIFEATWGGFFQTYNDGVQDVQAALADLGREFRIMRSSIKPYACCRASHSAIDLMLQVMREPGMTCDLIQRIVVRAAHNITDMVSVSPVESVYDAQFSLPYALAVAALEGRATLDQFDPPRASETRVKSMLERIDLVCDREMGDTDDSEGPRFEFFLRDGRTFSRQAKPISKASGSSSSPLSQAEVIGKAMSLLEPRLGASAAKAIVSEIENLDSSPSLTQLMSLLRRPIISRESAR